MTKNSTPWNKGKMAPEEHKMALRLAWIKRKEKGLGVAWNKGKSHTAIIGSNNHMWKGDNVNYYALHHWVNKHLGKPIECVYCGETEKRLEWASISHNAKRDLDDYISLCVLCHRRYDRRVGE